MEILHSNATLLFQIGLYSPTQVNVVKANSALPNETAS